METIIKKYEDLTLDELYDILKARSAVFVVEQDCPYQDLDDKDKKAIHIYIKDDDEIVAYLRVLPAGVSFEEPSLGRVISLRRRSGLGTKLLNLGIKVATKEFGATAIRIGAQLYAKPFYENCGFVQDSGEYLEDGIPHIEMLWQKT